MTQKTDFRALCAELLDELSGYASANPHHDSDALVARARAALAEPEPAPPTEGEVAELVAWIRGSNWNSKRQTLATRAADLLEQRHPAPVAVSEKPLAQEAYIAFVQICKGNSDDAGTYEDDEKLVRSALKRLAELEVSPQRHPTPVPVSERLPGPEDCDAEGRCWVGYPELTYSIADTGDTDTTTPEWRLEHQPLKPKGSRCCWLPAHALPLPQGEVE